MHYGFNIQEEGGNWKDEVRVPGGKGASRASLNRLATHVPMRVLGGLLSHDVSTASLLGAHLLMSTQIIALTSPLRMGGRG